jgi:hypothetical protein
MQQQLTSCRFNNRLGQANSARHKSDLPSAEPGMALISPEMKLRTALTHKLCSLEGLVSNSDIGLGTTDTHILLQSHGLADL